MTEHVHGTADGRQTHNVVTIYDVGDDGSTGVAAGTGVLVGPSLVVVHPPLGPTLVTDGHRALRAGISSGADDDRVVEVIDVDEVVRPPGDAGRTVATVTLRTPSTAVVDYLGATGPDDFLDTVLAYLASLGRRRPVRSVPLGTVPPYCAVQPWDPACSTG